MGKSMKYFKVVVFGLGLSLSVQSQDFVDSKYVNGNVKSAKKQIEQKTRLDEVANEYEKEILERLYGEKLETTVIYDSGNTVSIDRFYKKEVGVKTQQQKREDFASAKKSIESQMQEPSNETKRLLEQGHFPVKPEVISLSTMHRAEILRDIPQLEHNIFIVGDDEYSLAWLRENKAELVNFGASGVLTEVQSLERFKQIVEEFRPLSFLPISGDFAKLNFGVDSYPVLITKKGEFR